MKPIQERLEDIVEELNEGSMGYAEGGKWLRDNGQAILNEIEYLLKDLDLR